MQILLSVIHSIFLASLVGGSVMLLPHLLKQKGSSVSWALPLGVGLGFLTGYSKVAGVILPEFPPSNTSQWLYILTPLALVLSLFHTRLKALYFNSIYALLLSGLFYSISLPLHSSLIKAIIFSVIPAILLAFINANLNHISDEDPLSLSLIWLIHTLGSAAFFMLLHSASLNQLATILSALLSMVLVFTFFQRESVPLKMLNSLLLFMMAGLWSNGVLYAENTYWTLSLIPALLIGWAAKLPFIQKQPEWAKALILGGFSCVLIAIGIIGKQMFQAPVEDYYY